MAEYIDREKAIKIAEKYGLSHGSVIGRHSGIADCIAAELAEMEFFDDTPAVDAVPVVRCRECKFTYRIDGPKEEYDCRKVSAFAKFFKADHFCSYSEKKDGGSDE